VLHRVFEKTSQLVLLPVPMVAKEETDAEINARKNKQPSSLGQWVGR